MRYFANGFSSLFSVYKIEIQLEDFLKRRTGFFQILINVVYLNQFRNIYEINTTEM